MIYPPLPVFATAQGALPSLSMPDAPNADAVRFHHLCGNIIWSNCGNAMRLTPPDNDNRRVTQQRPAAAAPGAPWSSR